MDILAVAIPAVAAVIIAQAVGRSLMKVGKAIDASAVTMKEAMWLIADVDERARLEHETDDVAEPQQTLKSRYEVVGENVYVIKPKGN